MNKKKWKLSWINKLILAILGLFFFFLANDIWASADTFVNAQDEGLSTDKNVDNNKELQEIIKNHVEGKVVIYIPRGRYVFHQGAIVLHSNINFKFQLGAKFVVYKNQMLSFSYPSYHKGYNGGITNVSWENGTFEGSDVDGQSSFVQSMNHAQNISFTNCEFVNAENPEGHIMDIDGSRNIGIFRCTFIGFNDNSHDDYKEAIQIDYSNKKAMSYVLKNDKYDDLPSYNININNNRFLPLLVKHKIKYYAPNPTGEHITYNNAKAGIIHNIYFDNNEVVDSAPRRQPQTGTINFEGVSNVFIFNNHFSNIRALGPASYIRVHNPLKSYRMGGVYISKNTFSNINPTQQYIIIRSANSKNPFYQVYVENNKIVTDKQQFLFVGGGNPNIVQNGNKVLDVVTG